MLICIELPELIIFCKPFQKFHWVLSTPCVLKCFQIDLVSGMSSERKVTKNAGTSKFEFSQDPLGDVPNQPPRDVPLTSDQDVPWTSFQDIPRTLDQDVPGTVKQDLYGTSWGRWRGTSSGRPRGQYLPTGFLLLQKVFEMFY